MKSIKYLGYLVYEDGTIIGRRGKPMHKVDNGRGYLIVSLYINKRTTTIAVHKLVALCFVPNPLGFPEVNHKDGNKLNNHKGNLEWTTRGSNIKHAYDNKLRSAKGEENAKCLSTEIIVHEICNLLEKGFMPAQIRDLGYDYNLIRSIKTGKNWAYISDKYSW